MIDLDRVHKIIKAGRPSWVISAENDYKKYNTHINGVGTADYLHQMQKFENTEQYEARKQLATSNRHLFVNLARPIDKIFTATGGTSIYPKTNKENIIAKISNFRDGFNIRKWIQSVLANRIYVDPNGLIFYEWDKETFTPSIKSISSIFNYTSIGRQVNEVIFMPTDSSDGKAKIYRYVDNEFDYTLIVTEKSISIDPEKTYKNPFGKCPAIVNSNITHFELDRKDSPFAPVIELADHYLRTGSVKNIYENYHGYPIFWAYGQPCKLCHGEGSITTNNEVHRCPSCDGSGTSFKKDVTDGIKLKVPSDDKQKISPDVAGYVQPDLETWREQRAELKDLKEQMFFTLWGTTYVNDQETATATWINAQPVNEALYQFSELFEDIEQKMTELICLFYNKSINDVSINWGKRFMIESPDALWNKYINAKKEGANKTTLNYLLHQFYQSEYANDKHSLMTIEKLLVIEPFIHLTEKEVKDLGVSGFELNKKIYFNEWISSLVDGYIFATDAKKLLKEFETYVMTKDKPEE